MPNILGPIATLAAAVAASLITWRFSSQQARSAKQQADTALDQLRYNLFEKRYAIYKDLQQLLKLLLNESYNEGFSAFDVAQHYLVMDEAIFFFSPETCSWLASLQKDCQEFLEALASRNTPTEYSPTAYSSSQRKLLEHFKAMPERFREELGFRQLTQPLRS